MRSFALSFVISIVVAGAACSDDPVLPAGSVTGGGDGGAPIQNNETMKVTSEKLEVEGTAREYTLAVPKAYDERRDYPLVLVFHGDGGDGPGMRKYHTFDAASGDAAIVAYPTGLNQGWNLHEPSATNMDMSFIDALVASLSKTLKVDSGRVFGVGYSSGGYFIGQMACRKNGFFRGIVVHAGGAPEEPSDPGAGIWPSGYTKCKGQLPAPEGGVATLAIHGDQDDPAGGEFVATYWAALNGCQDSRSATSPAPCEEHDGCPADKPVVFCKIPGLGHAVWENGVKEGWAFIKKL